MSDPTSDIIIANFLTRWFTSLLAAIVFLIVLFAGTPDLHDALLGALTKGRCP